jgi:cytochrome c oxidase cbb3-type subunit III
VRLIGIMGLVLFAACSEGKPGAPLAGDSTRQSALARVPPSVRYDQHLFAGGMPPPGDTLRNPFAGQAKSVAEGEKLFASMNCDGCHGGGATGWVAPSLNDGRWRYGGSNAAIFHSIYYGRPKGMPAFGGVLAPEIIWKLVTYLQSLPPPKALPTQSW